MSMNIGKLESGGALKADTCNWASNMRLNIVEQIHAAEEALRKNDYDDIRVLEVDWSNHLKNLWIGGMTKALYTLLGSTEREELYGIDLWLRFLTGIKSVLCAINK